MARMSWIKGKKCYHGSITDKTEFTLRFPPKLYYSLILKIIFINNGWDKWEEGRAFKKVKISKKINKTTPISPLVTADTPY